MSKKKTKSYTVILTARTKGKRVIPFCILCDTADDITWHGVWIDDTRSRIICYSFCNECSKEFLNLSETDRESIVAKVIEKRLDPLVTPPLPRVEELKKLGLKVGAYHKEILKKFGIKIDS